MPGVSDTGRLNIARRLRETAKRYPQQRAVVVPCGRGRDGRRRYAQLTFAELDRESDRLARGLCRLGVVPGARIVLMVRPGLEYIALTFALFKTGAVIVLIDPGMGRTHIFRCLQEVDPDGFVAIPIVQVLRVLRRKMFPRARINVTVGRRWLMGGSTYRDILGEDWSPFDMADTLAGDPAAIIFTSGSTGPPKGVLYEHGMFNAQVDLIQRQYAIEPGEVDLSGFPLFALFNAAMGVTTVVPDMNPMRPADVNPLNIVESIRDNGVTQAFGSPAIWNRVGRYCEAENIELPTLRRVMAAGAPVPLHVIRRMRKALSGAGADIHTPYGATEALPICSISGREVMQETAAETRRGAGVCVGKPFPEIGRKIIEITDGPISSLDAVRELGCGEIGEIIVSGPSVTREYYRHADDTALAKIPAVDGRFWHRMGDVGYLDAPGRLWFCGRKAHIVVTRVGRMFPIPCEAIFNEHPRVFRSALVGVGSKPEQTPVIVVEPELGSFPDTNDERRKFTDELLQLGALNSKTENIERVLFHRSLPVDTRHNVKIARIALAAWAAKRLPAVASRQRAPLIGSEKAAIGEEITR